MAAYSSPWQGGWRRHPGFADGKRRSGHTVIQTLSIPLSIVFNLQTQAGSDDLQQLPPGYELVSRVGRLSRKRREPPREGRYGDDDTAALGPHRG